jgi:Domain of unknown function (DUF6249)
MEVYIVVAIGVAVIVLFIVAQVARVVRNRVLHATLRKLIESGQPLTPDIVEKLDRAPEPRTVDQRMGFVLIALALAVVAAGALNGSDDLRDLAAVAMFPLFVGAALLLRLRLSKTRRVEP